MEFIHIRNLEKFHPGYKDRKLQWAKIYFDMIQGDPDCELIEDEIDWGRLIKLILLELEARKPIPLNERYLVKKGFNLKRRPISLTIQMLHNFIELIQSESETCVLEKSKNKRRVREDKEEEKNYMAFEDATYSHWNSFVKDYPSLSKIEKISPERRKHLKARFENKHFRENLSKAIDLIKNYSFLRGENDRGWRINFDWLISNDTNYVKILEGRYQGKTAISDFKPPELDCQECSGTGWIETEEGRTICSCRRAR